MFHVAADLKMVTKTHGMSDSDTDDPARRFEEEANVENEPQMKCKGTVDLEAISRDKNLEVWLVRAPADMPVKRLHDRTLQQFAEETGFSAKVTKKKAVLPMVGVADKKPVAGEKERNVMLNYCLYLLYIVLDRLTADGLTLFKLYVWRRA